jgi:hypothetical protein
MKPVSWSRRGIKRQIWKKIGGQGSFDLRQDWWFWLLIVAGLALLFVR